MELPKDICECAFHLAKDDERCVCSSADIIEKIKDILIQNGINVNKNADRIDIIEKAKKLTGCNTESCVLTKPKIANIIGRGIVKQELEERFKPAGPADSYRTLLNNFNIDSVLDQLADTYPGFYHIPFQMIDFAKLAKSNEEMFESYGNSIEGTSILKSEKDKNLATIDIMEKFKAGYRTFGVVLNTDVSTGPGKHWFCLFVDLRGVKPLSDKTDNGSACPNSKNGTIEYFNSSGNMPLLAVSTWLADTRLKLMTFDKNVKVVRVVTERLQDDDYSCGVWVLYYILSRLNCISFNDFKPGKLNDSLMHQFRKHLFRHYDL